MWTQEELLVLEDCLKKYPEKDHTPLNRYVRIAQHLPGKTIRDVGSRVKLMRVRWSRLVFILGADSPQGPSLPPPDHVPVSGTLDMLSNGC